MQTITKGFIFVYPYFRYRYRVPFLSMLFYFLYLDPHPPCESGSELFPSPPHLILFLQASAKICEKVFDSKQWEECLLNTLANPNREVTLRGAVVIHNMILVRTGTLVH